MGRPIGLVLPGGWAGPYTASSLVPSLAVEEAGAGVKVVPYPEFRPRGLERADAREFDVFVFQRVVEHPCHNPAAHGQCAKRLGQRR
jgi:hypothetical protein